MHPNIIPARVFWLVRFSSSYINDHIMKFENRPEIRYSGSLAAGATFGFALE